jgi:LuxR family transcriptional regulator, maltose regulon positive regulatory protein
MAISLLKTKLYVPPVRPGLVSRPRLIARLDEGLRAGHKLALLSAPAGFGKTTLLSEWAAACGCAVAWVSLDEGDNDPARFWSYVVAALQAVHPEVGAAAYASLQAARDPRLSPVSLSRSGSAWIEAPLTSLINDLAECPGTLVLVLDDLHLIAGRRNHDALAFLLNGLPPHVHLVCSTRTDPPWPLARLRARSEITELRARELRFTFNEVSALVNEAQGLELTAEDVAALEARTEGWVAGLQMAALSMREPQDRTAFIARLCGTQRFILDYLVEEVLERQSPAIQDFMLRTSVLERMTAPLCDAVIDGSDSQAVLERLDRANLFVVPLDGERRWYRYHALFGELLRSRLRQRVPAQVPELHRRASGWYEQNGLISEAVHHALAAGDSERVAHLIEGNVLALLEGAELGSLERQLRTLPGEDVSSQPWLCIAQAWMRALTGQLDAAERVLGEIERTPGAEGHLAGHVAMIRAYAAAVGGDMPLAAARAATALERLPAEDEVGRGWALAHLGRASQWNGDYDTASRALQEAARISQAAGNRYLSVKVLSDLGVTHLGRGQLHDAADALRHAIQLAEQQAEQDGHPLPLAGYAHNQLAEVLCEWNELEAALDHARQGIELCQQWGQADLLAAGYMSLAEVCLAMRDREGALEALREAKQAASGVSPWFVARVERMGALAHLALGDMDAAARWADERGLSARDTFGPSSEFLYRALARVLVAKGRLGEALHLLGRLLEMAETAGAAGRAIQIQVLQARALQAQGKAEPALAALAHALHLGAPQGYVRTFVDGGQPLVPLLRQAAARGIEVAYVRSLLDALERETGPAPHAAAGHAPVEPLTERELEILRLLAVGLPNKEIAGTLVIAVGTVKQHLKHIYGKLGVHNRTEATVRARELGLV